MRKLNHILILAGGDSTRFWPLYSKNLMSFLGKPLMVHLVEKVKEYANEVTVVTSKEQETVLKNQLNKDVKLVVQDPSLPGMAGAVLSASHQIKGEVLILNANDFVDFAVLPSFLQKIESEKLDFAFLAKRVHSYFPGGYLQLEGDTVVGIIEKPNPEKVPSDLINLVVDYVANLQDFSATLKSVQTTDDDWFERGITSYMKNHHVGYLAYEGPWETIKFPWQVLSMMDYFFKELKPYQSEDVQISKTSQIEGAVFIGKHVRIGNYVRIVGPCYIGEGTVIGDFSLVRGSHIGNDCLIGGHTEIARSYISEGASLHRNYIGDSILGANVLFGAQAVTANFRFDTSPVASEIQGKKIGTKRTKLGTMIGDNSKIGVNTTILPGVKIGRNTYVGPGSIIDTDLPDNQFYFRNTVKPNNHV